MSRSTAGLSAERTAEMRIAEVRSGWRQTPTQTTAEDIAAAEARDSQTHWAGDGTAPTPSTDPHAAEAMARYCVARILGTPTAPPNLLAEAMRRRWEVSQRASGARGRIASGELLRRARRAAASIGAISEDERDALTGELVRLAGRRYGWTPESREVPISRLAQWASDLAARSAEKVARRSDTDADRDAWRDTADRRALYTDAPLGDAEDGEGETVGSVAASEALRSDPWTASRIRRDSATSSQLAEAMGLGAAATDALRAALAGWDGPTLAADRGISQPAARQRLKRGGDDIRAQWASPADLAAALLVAERTVADARGGELDEDRDPLAGPDLPGDIWAASDAVDRAARAERGVGGDTAARDRAVCRGRRRRHLRSRIAARTLWPASFTRATIGTAPQPMPLGSGYRGAATWATPSAADIAAAAAVRKARAEVRTAADLADAQRPERVAATQARRQALADWAGVTV